MFYSLIVGEVGSIQQRPSPEIPTDSHYQVDPTSPAISEGFPGGARGKDPACRCGRLESRGFTPWVARSPEKEMATCSSMLAWEIHGQRRLVGYIS